MFCPSGSDRVGAPLKPVFCHLVAIIVVSAIERETLYRATRDRYVNYVIIEADLHAAVREESNVIRAADAALLVHPACQRTRDA